MHRRKARGDLHGADGIRGLQRPHRHHHRPRERARGCAGNVGAVHRNAQAALDMADWNVVREQRFFKRVRTADHERHEIVAPVRHDIGRLLDQLAVPPHAIARDVRANVQVDTERGNFRIADIRHADDRARLRIELTETMKRGGKFFRQNRKIALHVTGRHAGGRRGRAASAGTPSRNRRFRSGRDVKPFSPRDAAHRSIPVSIFLDSIEHTGLT